ncbi:MULTISPECIES: hypothetical protein [Caproicibacterium]|uniref:Uncharacterized protein n=1 Tax=Caproicibacterium argilliputei TaxID=3030016 RepID=A0AA97D999_9FIRM|nr:hypothetical protein [Caproicibacterium argilliputei]WOC31664.1 hypothetical protein PXC00_10680 [Caproicibacterium argilliputei]
MKSDVMMRAFISAAVDKGFKDIARDPKRSVRQLVDLGTFFAKGRFQRYFFDIFGEMLHNESSSYYKLIHDLVTETNQKQLKTFGMNMAYNSWTVGAKTVRALEAAHGHNVPWTLVFRMEAGGALSVEMLDDVIRQGREMGIYCYVFFCGGDYPPLTLAPLLRKYRDCAFLLFLQDVQVDRPLVKEMLEVGNTLACLQSESRGFLEKAALLHSSGCFYAAWCSYGNGGGGEACSRRVLPQVLQAKTPFFFFVAEETCSAQTQEQMRNYTVHTRQAQQEPVFCVDFYTDIAFIDHVISSDACVLSFDKDGTAGSIPGAAPVQPLVLRRGTLLQTLLQNILPYSPTPQTV